MVDAGLDHPHPRQEAHLDGLAGHGEAPADQGLRGDDGRHGGEDDHAGDQDRVLGHQREERVEARVREGVGVAQQLSPLAEVVQQEGWHGQPEPAQPDRGSPEVAEVGVERLAGDRQGDRAEHDEAQHRVGEHEVQGVVRVDGVQDVGGLGDAEKAEDPVDQKPGHHDPPEEAPDAMRAEPLDHEKGDDDADGDRDHERLRRRPEYLEPLHGAQHGDRRRNHAVPEEQRGAEDAKRDQNQRGLHGVADQVKQRQDATLALVMSVEDEGAVLRADNQDDCPEDEADKPHDVADRQRMGTRRERDDMRSFLHCV